MSRASDAGADTGDSPSLAWRASSSVTILGVAALCRAFLYGCSRPETHGLDSFLEILDSRQDPTKRTKGLITGELPAISSSPVLPRYDDH